MILRKVRLKLMRDKCYGGLLEYYGGESVTHETSVRRSERDHTTSLAWKLKHNTR
jgi:hypothetical protein